jgi:hypothetical protein
MEERLNILRTKFCLRFSLLPADCLIRLITPLLTSNRLGYLRTNMLFRSLPTPFRPSELPEAVISYRLAEYHRRCSPTARNPILLRACCPAIGIDPILTVPATRTERSRLIRWRMGWLPGKPKPCPCDPDHQHTSRRRVLECLRIPPNLWEQLPTAPTGTNPIDFALSSLLTHRQPRPPFWIPLLYILRHVEQLCLPDIDFPDEPEPGASWPPSD